MRRGDFALTNAASGTTLNDGDAIAAAIREQHRLGVTAPDRWTNHAYPWSAAEQLARAKRGRR